MNVVKVNPAWERRTPDLLEGRDVQFRGRKLAIDASDGRDAVLTLGFSLAPGQPVPAGFDIAHALEVDGVVFRVVTAVLPSGEHVLRGSLPIADAASLFPVPATEGAGSPRVTLAQDSPAEEAPVPEAAPARKGLAARAREFAEARDELGAARARLPGIVAEAAELRQKLDSADAARREVEESIPALESAAKEGERALNAILQGRK